MNEKKEEIEKIKKNSIEKRRNRRLIISGIIGLLILSAGTYGFALLLSDYSLGDEMEYSKEVKINETINPYRTSIEKNHTVKFTNLEKKKVNLTFETSNIDKSMILNPNSSGYLNTENYQNLPRKNYYNTDSGKIGQLIIK